MTSISCSNHSHIHFLCRNHISNHLILSPSSLSFSRYGFRLCRFAALKTTGSESGGVRSNHDSYSGGELLRKPTISTGFESAGEETAKEDSDDEVDTKSGGDVPGWIDWEDQILGVTVPLVGFVRTIIHSRKYVSGERLSPEHEKAILQRLLPYHPECEEKIGCGIDYITVGYHPDFENSRCLFIVRKDGEMVDFSYWKCIKGLIKKKYPLYADSFILRHFRKRKHMD